MQTAVSRRSFVRRLGAGGLGALALPAVIARGREAGLLASTELAGGKAQPAASVTGSGDLVRLDSNENPNGPGARVLDAITRGFGEVPRYPDDPEEEVRAAVARFHGVPESNVLMGCGSTEVLRMAVDAFTSPARGLVTAHPTFEWVEARAKVAGAAATAIPVGGDLRLDLGRMAAAARGSGLVYVCNPNNPTATAHPAGAIREFVGSVLKASPGTTILIDEAYFEYAEDPACASALPLALESPRVIVSRTFSKIFGMAGLRLGYAAGDPGTLGALMRHKLPSGVNALAALAAMEALADPDRIGQQRALNRKARDYTRSFFEKAGYDVVPSETNFIMADIRRDSRAFRDACVARGVRIGRPFPPLTTHARVTIGTMDEMRRAVEVFREVLAP